MRTSSTPVAFLDSGMGSGTKNPHGATYHAGLGGESAKKCAGPSQFCEGYRGDKRANLDLCVIVPFLCVIVPSGISPHSPWSFSRACLLAMGCHSSASGGPIKVILQADWYPQPEHGGFYNALIKGYYKDEGLDVTIQPGGPYNSVAAAGFGGRGAVWDGSSDMILEAVADGQPLIAVAATMQHDPQGIMVRKDSPIQSFADLNGHTVAIKTGIDLVGVSWRSAIN